MMSFTKLICCLLTVVHVLRSWIPQSSAQPVCQKEEWCLNEKYYPACKSDCDCDGLRECRIDEGSASGACFGVARDCFLFCGYNLESTFFCNDGKGKAPVWSKYFKDQPPNITSINEIEDMIAFSSMKNEIIILNSTNGKTIKTFFPTYREEPLWALIFNPNKSKAQLVVCQRRFITVLKIFNPSNYSISFDPVVLKVILINGLYENKPRFDAQGAFMSLAAIESGNKYAGYIWDTSNWTRLILKGQYEFGKYSAAIEFMPNLSQVMAFMPENASVKFGLQKFKILYLWDARTGDLLMSRALNGSENLQIFPHPLLDNIVIIIKSSEVLFANVFKPEQIVKRFPWTRFDYNYSSGFEEFKITRTGVRLAERTSYDGLILYNLMTNSFLRFYMSGAPFTDNYQIYEKTNEFCKKKYECKNCSAPEFLARKANTCDAQCPEGTFGREETRMCESQCSLNEIYPNENDTYKVCKPCFKLCKTCFGTVAACTSCHDGQFLVRDKKFCAKQCPVDYYEEGAECVNCKTSPERCEGRSVSFYVHASRCTIEHDQFCSGSLLDPFKTLGQALSYIQMSEFLRESSEINEALMINIFLDEVVRAEDELVPFVDFSDWRSVNLVITSSYLGSGAKLIFHLSCPFVRIGMAPKGYFLIENLEFTIGPRLRAPQMRENNSGSNFIYANPTSNGLKVELKNLKFSSEFDAVSYPPEPSSTKEMDSFIHLNAGPQGKIDFLLSSCLIERFSFPAILINAQSASPGHTLISLENVTVKDMRFPLQAGEGQNGLLLLNGCTVSMSDIVLLRSTFFVLAKKGNVVTITHLKASGKPSADDGINIFGYLLLVYEGNTVRLSYLVVENFYFSSLPIGDDEGHSAFGLTPPSDNFFRDFLHDNYFASAVFKFFSENIFILENALLENINVFRGSSFVFSMFHFEKSNIVKISYFSASNLLFEEKDRIKGYISVFLFNMDNAISMFSTSLNQINSSEMMVNSLYILLLIDGNRLLMKIVTISELKLISVFTAISSSDENEYFYRVFGPSMMFGFMNNNIIVQSLYSTSSTVKGAGVFLLASNNTALFRSIQTKELHSTSQSAGFYIHKNNTVLIRQLEVLLCSSPKQNIFMVQSNLLMLVESTFEGNSDEPSKYYGGLIFLGASNYFLGLDLTLALAYVAFPGPLIGLQSSNLFVMLYTFFLRNKAEAGIIAPAGSDNFAFFMNITMKSNFGKLVSFVEQSTSRNAYSFFFCNLEENTYNYDSFLMELSTEDKLNFVFVDVSALDSKGNFVLALEACHIIMNLSTFINFHNSLEFIRLSTNNRLEVYDSLFSQVLGRFIQMVEYNEAHFNNSKYQNNTLFDGTFAILESNNVLTFFAFLVDSVILPTENGFLDVGEFNFVTLNKSQITNVGSFHPVSLLIGLRSNENHVSVFDTHVSGRIYELINEISKKPEEQGQLTFSLIKLSGHENILSLRGFHVTCSVVSFLNRFISFYIIHSKRASYENVIVINASIFSFKGFSGLLSLESSQSSVKMHNNTVVNCEIRENMIFFNSSISNFELFNSIFSYNKVGYNAALIYVISCLEASIKASSFKSIVAQSGSSVLNISRTDILLIQSSAFSFCQHLSALAPRNRSGMLTVKVVTDVRFIQNHVFCAVADGEQSALTVFDSNLLIFKSYFGFNMNIAGTGGVLFYKGTAVVTVTNNVFQSNQATLGGVFAFPDDKALISISSNVFLDNIAVGGASKTSESITLPLFGYRLDAATPKMGAGVFTRVSFSVGRLSIRRNVIRQLLPGSFYHELTQLKTPQLSENKFRRLNMIYSSKINELSVMSTLTNKESLKVTVSYKKMSAAQNDCLFILVGKDVNGGIFPLPSVKEVLLGGSLKIGFVTFFDQHSITHEKEFTCANKIEVHNSSQAWNEVEFTLEIKNPVPFTFDERLIHEYLVLLDLKVVLKSCGPGETLVGSSGVCTPCPRNSFSNSLDLSGLSLCETCLEVHNYNCYGRNLRSPKRSFWQPAAFSTRFLRCPREESCSGDPLFIEAESWALQNVLEDIVAVGSKISDRYCAKGYRGTLCAECELNLGIAPGFSCTDCSDWKLYAKQFLLILIRVVLTWLTVKKAFIVNRELSSLGDVSEEKKQNQVTGSYLIRIIQEHFQHLMILSNMPMQIPAEFKSPFQFAIQSSSNDIKGIFSLECLLKLMGLDGQIKAFYFAIFLQIFFNICTIIAMAAIISSWKNKLNLKNKERRGSLMNVNLVTIFKTDLHLILLYIFLTNLVGQSEIFLNFFFCYEIEGGGYMRLITDFSVDCNNNTFQMTKYVVAVPFLVVLLLYYPLKLFSSLRRNKKNLSKNFMLKKYAYFYYPYRESKYYFELISTVKRIAFLLLQIYKDELSVSSDDNSYVILTFYLLVYLALFKFVLKLLKPYKKGKFDTIKFMEHFSLNVLIFTSFGFSLWWLLKEAFFLTILVVVGGFNLCFVVTWFLYYFQYNLRERLAPLYLALKRVVNLECVARFVNKTFSNTFKKLSRAKSSSSKLTELTQRIANLEADLSLLKKEVAHLKIANSLLQTQTAALLQQTYSGALPGSPIERSSEVGSPLPELEARATFFQSISTGGSTIGPLKIEVRATRGGLPELLLPSQQGAFACCEEKESENDQLKIIWAHPIDIFALRWTELCELRLRLVLRESSCSIKVQIDWKDLYVQGQVLISQLGTGGEFSKGFDIEISNLEDQAPASATIRMPFFYDFCIKSVEPAAKKIKIQFFQLPEAFPLAQFEQNIKKTTLEYLHFLREVCVINGPGTEEQGPLTELEKTLVEQEGRINTFQDK